MALRGCDVDANVWGRGVLPRDHTGPAYWKCSMEFEQEQMRKLVLQMQISVDGFVSAEDFFDWQIWNFGEEWPWDAELKAYFNSVLDDVDCILLSRKMAEEGYLSHWASMAAAHWHDAEFRFARRIGEVEKVVVTKKPVASIWSNTRVAADGISEVVRELKDKPGADIICFGGARFASALLANGVVDELQLFVNPSYVGSGQSIFGESGAKLQLTHSKPYACGIVVSRYRPIVSPGSAAT